MKKNHLKALLSLVLAAVMIFSASLLAFASDQTQAVSDAALAYLEKNTYARYFYELYAQLLSDPDAFETYFAPAADEEGMFAALGEITRDYRLTPWTSCYCHAAEGVCLKKGYSAYSIHIGRTPWWKEA